MGYGWVEPQLKPMRCGRVGPGLKLRPEGWQDEMGKIIPPGSRAWSGLARRGCHREGVVKPREGERED